MLRTSLFWASARCDAQSISILPSHGARINALDMFQSPPLSLSAGRKHATCVPLLLLAGANPDPVFPLTLKGVAPASALNCAFRNAEDPMILKYLLDLGADINATGVDGVTALTHVMRRDHVEFAIVLLEYQADIDMVTKFGQTAFTAAIMYKSYRVLELLLVRWIGGEVCAHLQGPEALALYADGETVEMLTSLNNFGLMYEEIFTVENFVKLPVHRSDVIEELVRAFEELLGVFDQKIPSSTGNVATFMEAGLLPLHDSNIADVCKMKKHVADVVEDKGSWCMNVDDSKSDSDEEGIEFEDAREKLAITDTKACP